MPAGNDHLASAVALSGASGSVTMDFTGASYTETGSPDEATWWGGPHKSLWFRWTAPADGQYAFELAGPAEWDIAIGPDVADWDAWRDNDSAGLTEWSYQGSPQDIITATAGDVFLMFVDDYSYETGSPPTTAAVLSWEPYVPPPPAPTAGSWTSSDSLGFGSHTLIAGLDDATVAGTDLDTVTTVTVGGVGQSFTVTSPTQLVVHITSPATSGTIVVANISGSDPASGSATVLYPGPWIQDPDATATQPSYAAATYGTDDTVGAAPVSPTQPDIEGEPKRNDFGYIQLRVANGAFPDVTVTEMSWLVTGAVVVGQAEPAQYCMPQPDATPIFTANPDAMEIQYEADGGVAVSDVDVLFGVALLDTNEWVDDVDHKTATDLSGDLWTSQVEYRRLDTADWTSPDLTHVALTSAAWPSKTAIAALPLDYSSGLFQAGDSLIISTEDDSGLGNRTDNNAVHHQDPAPDPQPSSTVLTWPEYETGAAWLCAFDRMVDAALLDPPYVGSDPVFAIQRKNLSITAELQLTWTYRPPRYRLFYDTPPAPATTGWQVGSIAMT